jgi:Hemerythrin HHE cation binding domain
VSGRLQSQIDFYTGSHKGQRLEFSKISNMAGTLNVEDPNALLALQEELGMFRESMLVHARLEEKFVHPLLSMRVPDGAERLNEDHKVMRRLLDELVACLDFVKQKPMDSEIRGDLSLEFYRAWARFTAFYLNHIDFEEEHVMPTLWRLCSGDELMDAFRKVFADQTPKEITGGLTLMLPAMNLKERAMLLGAARATMPPEAFQAVLMIAENVLSPEDFASLKTVLKL